LYGLVSAGWEYPGVLQLFDQEQPGHYASTPNPDAYMENTYKKAVELYLHLKGR
jgi:hypothetical protein